MTVGTCTMCDKSDVHITDVEIDTGEFESLCDECLDDIGAVVCFRAFRYEKCDDCRHSRPHVHCDNGLWCARCE